MATKKITDLQLRSDFDATVNLPGDDASQTWRVTGQQIKDFVLAANSIPTAAIQGEAITLGKIAAAVQAALVPAGSVLAFAGTSAPTGYLFCDGSAVSRTTYADLFSAIGTAHGTGNGTTTFNLPDYRGRFLRGLDGSANRDPDKASRTAMATGGNTGNAVGSVQGHQFESHQHRMDSGYTGATNTTTRVNLTINTATSNDQPFTTANGGNETRPVNANVNYIIKT